jgi:hypothetical protein
VVPKVVSGALHTSLTCLSRYYRRFISFSHCSPGAKAILSQFANRLEAESTPSESNEKMRVTAKDRPHLVNTTSTRGMRRIIDSDSSDDDGDDSSSADAGDFNPSDDQDLDQDEDVIRAAEQVQQQDLDEAAQLAEAEINVTGNEQWVASTALSKVGFIHVFPYWSIY